jgi:hypothetical protein
MHGSWWQQRWIPLLGFAVVACIRTAALVVGWGSLESDPDAYRALAATWHDTGTLGRLATDDTPTPSAYRPPLYPWLLSWVSSATIGNEDRWWIACLHGVLGVATCIVTYDIARRLDFRPIPCWIAVACVACDPILIRQSTLVMTETTATFLGTVLWWLWLRDDNDGKDRWRFQSLMLGLGMGLAVLCRPTALAWIVMWWGAAFAMQQWRWVVASALGVLVAIAPWTIRNAMQFGTPIATTTHGGYTLYLANNPVLYTHWQTSVSREWDEEAFHVQWRRERSGSERQDEVALDHLAQSLAWSTIAGDPGTALRGCLIRVGWLWALWPSARQASPTAQIAIAAWYVLHFLLALLGSMVWTRLGLGRRRWLPGLALVISLTMVHCVYWSNMRMRAPAVPVLGLLAGVGWAGCRSGRASSSEGNRSFPA